LAARGNRLVRARRFGVAFVATTAVALWSTLPAFAQEAPPPAETTAAETTPTAPPQPTEPPPPPADPQPAPEPPAEPPPAPTTTGDGGTQESTPPAPDATPAPESTPAQTTPAETTPADSTAAKDAVKLEEPAAAAAPAAPVPGPTTAAPTPSAEPASGAPPAPSIVLEATPATATAAASAPAAAEGDTNAEAAVAAAELIVSFRPKAPASPIALLPEDEPAVTPLASIRPQAVKQLLRRQTCARPTARVPLSLRCKQARAAAVLRVNVTLTYVPSPEVRAAFARAGARVTVRKVDARPPPDSKAAKKHPIAEVRPTVPFGDSGQGLAKNGINGSTASSTWSSRVFALAAVPLRVPRPFRFARLRLPSTVPHGVIAAPPTARPG
jgi:hypothetical protein